MLIFIPSIPRFIYAALSISVFIPHYFISLFIAYPYSSSIYSFIYSPFHFFFAFILPFFPGRKKRTNKYKEIKGKDKWNEETE
jgi:hypothetical protein